jgi:hypothetical protein
MQSKPLYDRSSNERRGDTMNLTSTAAATSTFSPIQKPSPAFSRIGVRGKFLWAGEEKFYARGTTYGPFHPNRDGTYYPDVQIVQRDFAQIAASGMNAIRTYDVPPGWLLDIAQGLGLRILVGLQVEQLASFLDDRKVMRRIETQVRSKLCACAGHSAVLGYLLWYFLSQFRQPRGRKRWECSQDR